jgi:hypothetical protein
VKFNVYVFMVVIAGLALNKVLPDSGQFSVAVAAALALLPFVVPAFGRWLVKGDSKWPQQ